MCMHRTINFMHNNIESTFVYIKKQRLLYSSILLESKSSFPWCNSHTNTHTHTLNVFFISNPKACKMYTDPFLKGRNGDEKPEPRSLAPWAERTENENRTDRRRWLVKHPQRDHLWCILFYYNILFPKLACTFVWLKNPNQNTETPPGFSLSQCLYLITPVHHSQITSSFIHSTWTWGIPPGNEITRFHLDFRAQIKLKDSQYVAFDWLNHVDSVYQVSSLGTTFNWTIPGACCHKRSTLG